MVVADTLTDTVEVEWIDIAAETVGWKLCRRFDEDVREGEGELDRALWRMIHARFLVSFDACEG